MEKLYEFFIFGLVKQSWKSAALDSGDFSPQGLLGHAWRHFLVVPLQLPVFAHPDQSFTSTHSQTPEGSLAVPPCHSCGAEALELSTWHANVSDTHSLRTPFTQGFLYCLHSSVPGLHPPDASFSWQLQLPPLGYHTA